MAKDWPVSAHDPNDSALDYYICDCEAHVMPEDYRRFIKYFPGTATFEYAHKMCMHWHRGNRGTCNNPWTETAP